MGQWTREKPTKPGIYWLRMASHAEPRGHYTISNDDVVWVSEPGPEKPPTWGTPEIAEVSDRTAYLPGSEVGFELGYEEVLRDALWWSEPLQPPPVE